VAGPRGTCRYRNAIDGWAIDGDRLDRIRRGPQWLAQTDGGSPGVLGDGLHSGLRRGSSFGQITGPIIKLPPGHITPAGSRVILRGLPTGHEPGLILERLDRRGGQPNQDCSPGRIGRRDRFGILSQKRAPRRTQVIDQCLL
jgi:hypothetical protein